MHNNNNNTPHGGYRGGGHGGYQYRPIGFGNTRTANNFRPGNYRNGWNGNGGRRESHGNNVGQHRDYRLHHEDRDYRGSERSNGYRRVESTGQGHHRYNGSAAAPSHWQSSGRNEHRRREDPHQYHDYHSASNAPNRPSLFGGSGEHRYCRDNDRIILENCNAQMYRPSDDARSPLTIGTGQPAGPPRPHSQIVNHREDYSLGQMDRSHYERYSSNGSLNSSHERSATELQTSRLERAHRFESHLDRNGLQPLPTPVREHQFASPTTSGGRKVWRPTPPRALHESHPNSEPAGLGYGPPSGGAPLVDQRGDYYDESYPPTYFNHAQFPIHPPRTERYPVNDSPSAQRWIHGWHRLDSEDSRRSRSASPPRSSLEREERDDSSNRHRSDENEAMKKTMAELKAQVAYLQEKLAEKDQTKLPENAQSSALAPADSANDTTPPEEATATSRTAIPPLKEVKQEPADTKDSNASPDALNESAKASCAPTEVGTGERQIKEEAPAYSEEEEEGETTESGVNKKSERVLLPSGNVMKREIYDGKIAEERAQNEKEESSIARCGIPRENEERAVAGRIVKEEIVVIDLENEQESRSTRSSENWMTDTARISSAPSTSSDWPPAIHMDMQLEKMEQRMDSEAPKITEATLLENTERHSLITVDRAQDLDLYGVEDAQESERDQDHAPSGEEQEMEVQNTEEDEDKEHEIENSEEVPIDHRQEVLFQNHPELDFRLDDELPGEEMYPAGSVTAPEMIDDGTGPEATVVDESAAPDPSSNPNAQVREVDEMEEPDPRIMVPRRKEVTTNPSAIHSATRQSVRLGVKASLETFQLLEEKKKLEREPVTKAEKKSERVKAEKDKTDSRPELDYHFEEEEDIDLAVGSIEASQLADEGDAPEAALEDGGAGPAPASTPDVQAHEVDEMEEPETPRTLPRKRRGHSDNQAMEAGPAPPPAQAEEMEQTEENEVVTPAKRGRRLEASLASAPRQRSMRIAASAEKKKDEEAAKKAEEEARKKEKQGEPKKKRATKKKAKETDEKVDGGEGTSENPWKRWVALRDPEIRPYYLDEMWALPSSNPTTSAQGNTGLSRVIPAKVDRLNWPTFQRVMPTRVTSYPNPYAKFL